MYWRRHKTEILFFMVTWVGSLVLNNVQLYVQCYTVYTCICTMLYNMHMHIRKIPISQILLVGKLANSLLNTHLCMIWTLSGPFDHGVFKSPNPVNTKHLYSICTMLDQRRRRWADVVQMVFKGLLFAEKFGFKWPHCLQKHTVVIHNFF